MSRKKLLKYAVKEANFAWRFFDKYAYFFFTQIEESPRFFLRVVGWRTKALRQTLTHNGNGAIDLDGVGSLTSRPDRCGWHKRVERE